MTDEQIIEVLKLANAQFVLDLKEGLNTRVGDLGSQLSGGQKQRLAIARALIKKPSILIFDEATSALDHQSEIEVQKAITNIQSKEGSRITQIIIAHRISSIQHCDQIFVLNNGQILEQGSHLSLIENYPEGIYVSMVQKQQKSNEEEHKVEQIHPEADQAIEVKSDARSIIK